MVLLWCYNYSSWHGEHITHVRDYCISVIVYSQAMPIINTATTATPPTQGRCDDT